MRTLTIILTVLAVSFGKRASAAVIAAKDPDCLVECLRSSLSAEGAVYVSGDDGFANDTIRWNRYHQPTFSVVAAVANEHDVRASIQCATSTDTPFLVTGPRHGFTTGWEALQDGLGIFTGAFTHVSVDAAASTMVVEGAAAMKDVFNALQPVGKNIRKSRIRAPSPEA